MSLFTLVKFALWVSFLLNTAESFLLSFVRPACRIPGFKSSEFCRSVFAPASSTSRADYRVKTPRSLHEDAFCSILPSSGSYLGLCDHERSPSTLINDPPVSPAFGREIRNFVIALEDLVPLLKGSSLRNRLVLASLVPSIQQASRETVRWLQKDVASLLASINMCIFVFVALRTHLTWFDRALTASAYAIDRAHHNVEAAGSLTRVFSKWFRDHVDREIAESAYRQALKAVRALNHQPDETYKSLKALENIIEGWASVVYEEGIGLAPGKTDDGLAQIWATLWHKKPSVANQVATSMKKMKSFILDIHLHLESVQASVDALRAQAPESPFVDGRTPVESLLHTHSLMEASFLLKGQLATSATMLDISRD
ncbi:hypothetical protein NLJ89_g8247 [Agrocybe chaxingu]|uniref:Uncharacterized protein n=1 Tax=Agrocybe chaxingu TaxID=84603 RepID=A0A9W8JV91_9AGAR|nr:hypothetical protein NLJ89_g8247 [Agrocybe chaxingu]